VVKGVNTVTFALILGSPAAGIARKSISQPVINVPSRGQLKALVQAIRTSDGRADSQAKAKAGADLFPIQAALRRLYSSGLSRRPIRFRFSPSHEEAVQPTDVAEGG
jgi:hypothetical protein